MKFPMSELLPLLACPCEAHGALTEVDGGLVSQCCNTRFEIEDGIPVLLLPEKK